MIGINFTFVDSFAKVEKAADTAQFRNFSHAAAAIRKDVIASIVPSIGPSAPGTPPHTRIRITKSGKNKGKLRTGEIQRAMTYNVDKTSAIIGPRFSVLGTSGMAHEFGGEYKGELYPERSYMKPALDRNSTRFAQTWEGSIGE